MSDQINPLDAHGVRTVLNHVEQKVNALLSEYITDNLLQARWTWQKLNEYVDWIMGLEGKVQGLTVEVRSWTRLQDSIIPGLGGKFSFGDGDKMKLFLSRFDGALMSDLEFHYVISPWLPVIRITHTTVVEKGVSFDDIVKGIEND